MGNEGLRLTNKSPSPESQRVRGTCFVACDRDCSGMRRRARSKPVTLFPFLFGIRSELENSRKQL